MIFVKIHRRINARKVLNKEYMFSFFQKRKKKFFKEKDELINLKIELIRNFRGKFRNMSLKYELLTNKESKIVRAKIHSQQDVPRREWQVLNRLKKAGLKRHLAPALDYFKPLNIFFYQEVPGKSLEELLSQKKVNIHLKVISQVAGWLRKVHQISKKSDFLPIKNRRQELIERRHWFFIVRKCAPKFYPLFQQLLKELWQFKQKNKDIFLNFNQFGVVHGDFHWGNVIVESSPGQFTVIDFGYAFLGDPMEDVGGFLAQNDSMFHYYAPDFLVKGHKIRELFLKNYFTKKEESNDEIKKRLLYFEIQKILEMAAILGFIESNEEDKNRGMTTLLTRAKEKLSLLNYY